MLTVITPAMNTRLTTVATVKAELGITGSIEDSWIGAVIDRASDTIARWCNRVFAQETVGQVIRLQHPDDALVLARFPVVAVTSVTVNGTALTGDEYEADANTGSLHRLDANGDRSPWPAGKITVTYAAGYVLPGDDGRDLPHDIEWATMLLVKTDYFARQRDPCKKTEVIEGMGRDEWFGGGAVIVTVQPLLAPYRQPVLG